MNLQISDEARKCNTIHKSVSQNYFQNKLCLRLCEYKHDFYGAIIYLFVVALKNEN